MEKLFGIPAHPLMIHAPVVIIPFTTLVAALFMFSTTFRRRFFLPFLAMSVIGVITTFLAKQSGEAFDETLKGLAPIDRHAELADITMVLTAATMFASIALLFVLRSVNRSASTAADAAAVPVPVVELLSMLLVLVLSVLASIWMIRTGHEGARVVWEK